LIAGKFFCNGSLENPDVAGTNPKSQGGSGQKGAASTLSAMTGALGLAAMAAVLLI
jgi:hypothetical protein